MAVKSKCCQIKTKRYNGNWIGWFAKFIQSPFIKKGFDEVLCRKEFWLFAIAGYLIKFKLNDINFGSFFLFSVQ